MEKKKKINWLKILVILLFIAYSSLYILNMTGYYDGSIRRKVEFTNEQIKKFETDISNGVEVDLNDYLKDQNKDYTNKTSNFGFYISSSLEKILNEGIKEVGKILSRLFT